MAKKYTYTKLKGVTSLFTCFVLGGIVGVIVKALTMRTDYAIYAGGGVAILLSIFTLLGFKKYVIIDGNTFTYHTTNNELTFPIDKSSFRCISRDRGDKDIYVTYNGEETYLDCEFLSYGQYSQLLNDLHVTGEDQAPIKLTTRK